MYDDNLHITPKPEKGFPQPEIPADEAWDKMAGLLDAQMPAGPAEPPVPPAPSSPASGWFFGLSSKFWIFGTLIVASAVVLIWGVVSFSSNPRSSSPANDNETALSDTQQIDRTTTNEVQHASATVQPVAAGTTGITEQDGDITSANQQRTENHERQKLNDVDIEYQHEQTESEEIKTTGVPLRGFPDKVEVPAALPPFPGTQGTEIPEKSTGTIETQSEPVPADTVKVSAPAAALTDTLNNTNRPGDASNPPEKQYSGDRGGNPGNLQWYVSLEGNVGQTVQKGREPNAFFGGMLTAGFWHKKLNAGIETGIGWGVNKDYGSEVTTIRIDSIPADTMGHMTYIDTTRTEVYQYQYRYLQVPLLITKQLYSNRNFSFDLKTGLVVGFLLSEKRSLDRTSGPEWGQVLDTDFQDYTRLDLSWQWQLAPQFRWAVSPKLSLVISPACTFYLNNLYEKNNRPVGTPFGLGINGGIIYRF